MDIQIVDMTPEYREEYIAMSEEFYGGEAVLARVDRRNFERTLALLQEKSPFLRGVILLCEGETAGYGLLSFTYSCEAGGMVTWAEELFLKPEFRGKGLGAAYLKWLVREYGSGRIRLEVSPGNASVMNLYRRYGFRPLEYVQMKREGAEE